MKKLLPIEELLRYWKDLSTRPTLNLNDFKEFLVKNEETLYHFSKYYRWDHSPSSAKSSGKFFEQAVAIAITGDPYLKALLKKRRRISNREYSLMKDFSKQYISRIKKCFPLTITRTIKNRAFLEDAEIILNYSDKISHKWAAGIIASNYLVQTLIKLSKFKKDEKYRDDILTLSSRLKSKTTNKKLKLFLIKGYRRFEDADKTRNRCAHVNEGYPTKQEIEQLISLGRLLQEFK